MEKEKKEQKHISKNKFYTDGERKKRSKSILAKINSTQMEKEKKEQKHISKNKFYQMEKEKKEQKHISKNKFYTDGERKKRSKSILAKINYIRRREELWKHKQIQLGCCEGISKKHAGL